jgi:hypothetical protein
MLIRAALLAVLAGCAAPQRAMVPAELHACPAAAEAPPRLPVVRSPEALLARYYAERAARIETMAALNECAERLARVLEITK